MPSAARDVADDGGHGGRVRDRSGRVPCRFGRLPGLPAGGLADRRLPDASASSVRSDRRARAPARAGMNSAASAPNPTTTAPDRDGRLQPGDVGRRRRVVAVGAEDRGEDRDAEHAADLADRVGRTGRLALLLGADGRQDDVGDRGEEQAHADAGQDERHDHRLVVDRRRDDGGQPAEGDGLERHPGGQDRTAADAVGEDPGDRGDDDRHPRPRQRPQAGLERAVALDDLEELGEQEDRAEHPEVHQQRDGVGGAERAAAEEAERQHRVGAACLPERRSRRGAAIPATIAATICGLVQPRSLPLMTPHTRASRPALMRPRPGRSRRPSGP